MVFCVVCGDCVCYVDCVGYVVCLFVVGYDGVVVCVFGVVCWCG